MSKNNYVDNTILLCLLKQSRKALIYFFFYSLLLLTSGQSFADDKGPRTGSPFPRRKEFPPTAFSPSKTARSQALRSFSLEEEADDDLGQHNPEEGIGWGKTSSQLFGVSGVRGYCFSVWFWSFWSLGLLFGLWECFLGFGLKNCQNVEMEE